MGCAAECLDAPQWKVCCGQTEPQSWQEICQDVCPFSLEVCRSGIKDADILCSGTKECFTFPGNVDCCTHISIFFSTPLSQTLF